MPSRQDQLHSYQFTVQRVVAALVMRETDPARSPFRRVAGATLVGVLLAALAFGGAAAYGVLSPGGSGKWRNEKAVIVERESGAIYVYRDELLHPVLNYPSALLILNVADAKSVTVSRNSLTGVPRGAAWGIAGAPASLPPKERLLRGGWTVCTNQGRSVLFVGPGPAGSDLGGRVLLVSTSDGGDYVLWRGYKHLVRQQQVLNRLLWDKDRLTVSPAFLNAIPAGTDLAWPVLNGRGQAARPPGTRVGQLFSVERPGGGFDYFVVLADGLASITRFQAEIMLSDPETANLVGQRDLVKLSSGDFASLTRGQTVRPFAPDPGGDGALPTDVPPFVPKPSGVVCTGAGITLDVRLPDLSSASTPRPGTSGALLADRVVVPPGAGALVASVAAPGAAPGGLSLVTDLGIRYTVPSVELVPVLGYGDTQPVNLPAEVVALLPAGPALDPSAARG